MDLLYNNHMFAIEKNNKIVMWIPEDMPQVEIMERILRLDDPEADLYPPDCNVGFGTFIKSHGYNLLQKLT